MRIISIITLLVFSMATAYGQDTISTPPAPAGAEFSPLFWGCKEGISLEMPDSIFVQGEWYANRYHTATYTGGEYRIKKGFFSDEVSLEGVKVGIQTLETWLGEVTLTFALPRFNIPGARGESINFENGALYYRAEVQGKKGYQVFISRDGIKITTLKKGKVKSVNEYLLPETNSEFGKLCYWIQKETGLTIYPIVFP